MTTLTIGANLAWQIAASEAAAARFQFIEPEHLFMGIFSLEKVLMLSPADSGLNEQLVGCVPRTINSFKNLIEQIQKASPQKDLFGKR